MVQNGRRLTQLQFGVAEAGHCRILESIFVTQLPLPPEGGQRNRREENADIVITWGGSIYLGHSTLAQ